MAGTTGTTVTATGLIESIGVNTHIPYTDGNYADTALIAQNLAYLGLDQVRDQITNGESGTPDVGTYAALASEGIKFTFYIQDENFDGGGQTSSEAYVDRQLSLANSLPAGSITAIEGPNEVNNQPFTWINNDGSKVTDAYTAAIDEQQAIVNDIKNYANLKNVPIDYFTGYNEGSPTQIAKGPDPVSAGLATYDNQHPYPGVSAPAAALLRANALSNTSNPSEPAVYTETGYATNDVGQVVQAKYTLDLIMDAVNDGIVKTYIYELMDAYPTSSGANSSRGLFSYVGTDYASHQDAPKGVAVAIHNLTTILGDNGNTFTPKALNYAVTGLPTSGNTMAVQESNGNYYVVVWAEPSITASSPTGPSENVTVNLAGSGYTAKALFDPLGTDGLGTNGTVGSNVSGTSVTFALTDHPILVEVTPTPACYHLGTRILTPTGEVLVEELMIGDTVVTRSGAIRPIKWIGRRSYSGPLARANKNLAPVCFKAGSLADGVPKRDLWVSGHHAMYLLGALIPASLLINDRSIVRIREFETIHYFHLELESHDVIFADGAASETFYDEDGRGMFQNAAEFSTLYPGLNEATGRDYFAPRLEEGFELEALRERLKARSFRLQSDGIATAVQLEGFLDVADRTHVAGWAWDRHAPQRHVDVVALCNGVIVGRTRAGDFREDLVAAGIGDGRHSFELHWDLPFAPDAHHEIDLRFADDFTRLQGSPLFIEPELLPISIGGELKGHFDAASTGGLTGWALNAENPHQPVGLVVTVDGSLVTRVVANRYRDDLAKLGIGTGRHAFELSFSNDLSADRDHVIEIQREIDRVHLPNSPLVLKAGIAAAPNRTLEEMLDEISRRTATEADQAKALSLLSELSRRLSNRSPTPEAVERRAPALRKVG